MITSETEFWQGKPIRSYHITLFPAGTMCNLACSYCTYVDREHSFSPDRVMSLELLNNITQQYINSVNSPSLTFTWSGGEPTLAGLDFFRQALEIQQAHCPPHMHIFNEIHTNGLLLDDDWCEFLKENDFTIGLSIDGPPQTNDLYRRTRKDEETGRDLLQINYKLQQHHLDYTLLLTVTKETIKKINPFLNYLSSIISPRAIHFNPVFIGSEAKNQEAERRKESSEDLNFPLRTNLAIDAESYGIFLLSMFDYWMENFGKIHFTLFEALLAMWQGQELPFCELRETCGDSLLVDSDGSVYPCIRSYTPGQRLGKIQENDLSELLEEPRFRRFCQRKKDLSYQCQKCKFVFSCNGGCPQRRENGEEDKLCEAYLALFRKCHPIFSSMTDLQRERGEI